MTKISASEARSELEQLIERTMDSDLPVTIIGSRHEAVLLSTVYWNSIQETLQLLSIPGMSESIREGLATPLDQCEMQLRW